MVSKKGLDWKAHSLDLGEMHTALVTGSILDYAKALS